MQASAPGKLLLLGEYAVLEGAPALVTAINHRAKVTVQDIAGPCWQLTAPQLGIRNLALGDRGLPAPDTPPDIRASLQLYTAVLESFAPDLHRLPAQAVEIDTAEFFNADQKLGLGSSAAVAVALSGILAARIELGADRQAIFNRAAKAHRAAQGGVGSNADIAASVHGGTLVHTIGDSPASIALPGDLEVHTVFTGHAASTPQLVGSVFDLRDADPAVFTRHMQRMTTLAVAGCEACRSGDSAGFMSIANEYHDAMRALGQAAGANIISPAHEKLYQRAKDAGLAYKPSGAGGGDIGLILGQRDTGHSLGTGGLRTAVETSGVSLLQLEYGAPGLKVM